MPSVWSFLSVFILISITSIAVHANQITLVDSDNVFYPAQEVSVHFAVEPSIPDAAKLWVGVFNKGASNLRSYSTYKYLGKATGTLNISLPVKPGEYELLLADNKYTEQSANRIAVVVAPIDPNNLSLSIDSATVKPGEKFTAQFSASVPLSKSAWVGIFAEDVPHGQNKGYASYLYVKQDKQLTFTAPQKEGNYELRFIDSNYGNEVLAVPLMVNANGKVAASVATAKTTAEVASNTADKPATQNPKVDKLLNNIKAIAAKGKSERDLRKQAWAAKAANFSPMQDKNVQRLLTTQSAVVTYMESVKAKPNAEQEKIMQDAAFAGESYNAFLSIFKGKPELVKLDSIAKQNGYSGYQQFANHADRVQKVLFAVPWILVGRDMVFGDQPKPEPIDNLLAYLQDESKPKADREKMTNQLYDLIGDYKTNQSDVAFVTKHYAELKSIFEIK